MENKQDDKKGNVGERDFQARSASGIFGAPISWVSMIGALMGALAIVPFLFYPVGGGYTSLGMGIFGPMAGILLGPWAGGVAGLIGGLIGMFIAPGAYMFGFVDVFLSGVFLPLAWGLVLPKFRKIGLIVFPLVMIAGAIYPYYWPGAAAGVEPETTAGYFLSYAGGWLALLMYLFAFKPIWNLVRSPDSKKSFIGYFLVMYMANWFWMSPWMYVAYGIARFPLQVAIVNTWGQAWMTAIPMALTSALISFFLIRAMKQGNLRRVPGSYLTLDED
jgi:hypothetical protein